MKKNLQNALGCLAVLALVCLGIWRLGWLFRPFETDVGQDAIETFHTLPENSVEVIGYGCSHIFRSLDVMEMYEKYGIGAYNYGCHWQHINTTQLFLKDSLRTQSPKVVIIEASRVFRILSDVDMDGEIYYTRFIRGLDAKKDYLKQCFGDNRERYLSYYLPFAAFHENWASLEDWSFRDGREDNDFLKTMGYLPLEQVTPITIPDWRSFEQLPLPEESLTILDDILADCREAGAEVIFYTAPWQREFNYGQAMKDYAESRGCVYFDFFEQMDEVGIDPETDFSDKEHLNTSGAKKAADFLGAYIVEHYDVTDMRTIEGNQWARQLESAD